MAGGDFAETLIGFDAREMEPTGLRSQEPGGGRPTQFLLRTDLEDVLSADTMVWPSIFGSDLQKPEWIGMNAPFWEDLGALRTATTQSDRNTICLIAATWHTDLGFEMEEKQEGKFLGPYLTPTNRNAGTVRGASLVLILRTAGSSAASQTAGTTTSVTI